jgi:hypothetical protein
MKKLCLLFLALFVLFSSVEMAFGQREKPNRRDFIGASGDPDSFGQNVKFMGVVITGVVYLDATCIFAPGELLPEDRCIMLNAAPGATNFDVKDIGRLTLPANSSKDILAFMGSHNRNYQFFNSTGVVQPSAFFGYVPYITIESDALKDPRALDPETNLPLNGKWEIGLSASTAVDRSLAINERIRDGSSYSRTCVNCLSKTFFVESGIPADVIDRMYHGPITIRLNLRGSAKLVSDAFMLYAIRFFGD